MTILLYILLAGDYHPPHGRDSAVSPLYALSMLWCIKWKIIPLFQYSPHATHIFPVSPVTVVVFGSSSVVMFGEIQIFCLSCCKSGRPQCPSWTDFKLTCAHPLYMKTCSPEYMYICNIPEFPV